MIAVIKPTAIKMHTTTNAIATTFRNVPSMLSVSIGFTSVNVETKKVLREGM